MSGIKMDAILIVFIVYVAIVVVFSIWSFFAMMMDKRAAESGAWRTSECKLHILEAMGGYPGSFFAQLCFRHKTKKISYQIPFWLIVTGHIACLVGLFFLAQHFGKRDA
jgi:uncharacterized membrane protein YsdA (DUF1294 family)